MGVVGFADFFIAVLLVVRVVLYYKITDNARVEIVALHPHPQGVGFSGNVFL